jgi:spore maturation protein CgeB
MLDKKNIILFLGSTWWGSDCKSLSHSFRKDGHVVFELNPEDYFPIRWEMTILKVVRRLIISFIKRDYNKQIKKLVNDSYLDFVIAFKGNLLSARTIKSIQKKGISVYCFYPDVSFFNHGGEINSAIKVYDCIFTTKDFHLKDKYLRSNIKEMIVVNHGYDPFVHRKLDVDLENTMYNCDISFVGAWSLKKESIMEYICNEFNNLNINIWGPNWEKANGLARKFWRGRSVRGDELILQYRLSKINLGILSGPEGKDNNSDSTTTRTWHIPASNGFLIHEYSSDIENYFIIDKEIVVYYDLSDLKNKISKYLNDSKLRNLISDNGYEKVNRKCYDYSSSIKKIISYHQKNKKK